MCGQSLRWLQSEANSFIISGLDINALLSDTPTTDWTHLTTQDRSQGRESTETPFWGISEIAYKFCKKCHSSHITGAQRVI